MGSGFLPFMTVINLITMFLANYGVACKADCDFDI